MTFEKVNKVGVVLKADIDGEVIEGMVTGTGVHRGELVVDLVVDGEGRFVYLSQIVKVTGNRKGDVLDFEEVRYLKEGTKLDILIDMEPYDGAILEKKAYKRGGKFEITFKHKAKGEKMKRYKVSEDNVEDFDFALPEE